jgi:cytochrome bd ubiquinol oxidase subunit II
MLAAAWFAFIIFGLVMYVTLDGNDLGIGILSLTRRKDADRRQLLELVTPVWDGAESWILLIAVGLWGGFPAVTGGLLPAVYLPVIVMLWSLIMRGVSIEMISTGGARSPWWGRAFVGGSFGAAFAQGMIIGALVQGIPLGPDSHFAGGSWDFFSGYTVLTGLVAVLLYSLSGAAMVKMRSDDPAVRTTAARWGRWLVPMVAGMVALSAVLLPTEGASNLTLDQPLRVALMVGVSVAAATLLLLAWWSFGRPDHDYMAFVGVSLAEVAGIAGLIILSYPMILPPSLTIAHAASPSSSLVFLLGGVSLFIPIAVAYNAYAFWVLRPRRSATTRSLTPTPGPAPTPSPVG